MTTPTTPQLFQENAFKNEVFVLLARQYTKKLTSLSDTDTE